MTFTSRDRWTHRLLARLGVTSLGVAALAAVSALAATATLFAQVRPPAIVELSQYGLQRGVKTTITIDGQNLQDADRLIFDDQRITARIVSRRDKGPDVPRRREGQTDAPITDIARKTELIVEIDVPHDVAPGTHGFRVRTPLGTTALRTFAIGTLPELDETEMNDEPGESQQMTLPMTANGALQRGGDIDHYRFEAKAGQQIVFALVGAPIGSRVDSTLTLLDADGKAIAANDDLTWQIRDSLLVHTFERDGSYAIRIADSLDAGGPRDFHYRLTAAAMPYVTSIFPLGGARDGTTRFAIEGLYLGLAARSSAASAAPATAKTAAATRGATAASSATAPSASASPTSAASSSPYAAATSAANKALAQATQAATVAIRLTDPREAGASASAASANASTAAGAAAGAPGGAAAASTRRSATTRAGQEGGPLSLSVSTPVPDVARVQTAVQTDTLPLKLHTADGIAFNERRVARGIDPEIVETEALSGAPTGQLVTWPVTINGRIAPRHGASTKTVGAKSGAATDTFRIRARKGERVVFAVGAERFGSPLDAVLEVLDAAGRPIPRAIVRPVWETSVDLRDHNSTQGSMRLLSTTGLRRGDYIFVDRELMQIRELPKGPDEDTPLTSFRGRRYSFEATSGESHANTRPVYKVEIHPPGTKLSPNGLPLFELFQRNDDGGPMYGKDPYLDFTAPADGQYLVRLADTRGRGGRDYAYRLTIAPPRPDFTIFLTPTNPNVPRGSRVPVNVAAYRHDGFNGPITVRLTGLPAGFEATTGVILPDNFSVSVTLEAKEDAPDVTVPFSAIAEAQIGDKTVTRTADLERVLPLVSVTQPPDVRVVSVEPRVIEIEPGKRAKVHVKIARGNGFAGRVPLNVQNLPFRVTVPNIGLNGILITEQQDERDFIIEADPAASPLEQTLYVTARAEVNSGEPTERASTPITLRIVPAAGTPTAAGAASPEAAGGPPR